MSKTYLPRRLAPKHLDPSPPLPGVDGGCQQKKLLDNYAECMQSEKISIRPLCSIAGPISLPSLIDNLGTVSGRHGAQRAQRKDPMKLDTIASKLAKIIARTADANAASAPVVALIVHAVASTKGDAVDTLARLYLRTFESAPATKRKAVQSHFTRLKGLMSALVDFSDHPSMMDTIKAELALVDITEDECRQAEGAKRFPKSPVFTKAADEIRRSMAESVEGAFSHDHADLHHADTVGEALGILDEAITKYAEIRASLEAYRNEILTNAVGAPTDFEIRGDTNAAPSFSVKTLS